jgi:hypothetical protein
MSTRIRRTSAAAVLTCAFALTALGQIDPTQAETGAARGEPTIGGTEPAHGPDRSADAFGGAVLAVQLLGNLLSHNVPDEHVGRSSNGDIHFGNFRILASRHRNVGTTAGAERRAQAPRPAGI